VQGRDAEVLSQLRANENDAAVSLEAITQNPWSAVYRRLPENADRTVLERTAFAAQECSKVASLARRVAGVADPDVARVYGWIGEDASARSREASRLLQALPLDEISKVSPLLDRKQVYDTALVHLKTAVAERRPHGIVTADRIEENPWSIIRCELRGAQPELLRRVQDVAAGLVNDASERRDGSDTPEEAWLWDGYAAAAESVYGEALDIEREGAHALIGMVGEALYLAVNLPVADDADAAELLRLSDDLDAVLDRLDALNRSGGTGISPDYIAWQYRMAAARQDEVERRLGAMDGEIDRNLSRGISSQELDVNRSAAVLANPQWAEQEAPLTAAAIAENPLNAVDLEIPEGAETQEAEAAAAGVDENVRDNNPGYSRWTGEQLGESTGISQCGGQGQSQ
jgi:hypothetical protein